MPKAAVKLPSQKHEPYWTHPQGSAILWLGDVRDVLRLLPEKSVHCVVTSPPYHGLRDYGTASWVGGDPNCTHQGRTARTVSGGPGKQYTNIGSNSVYSGDCLCGAKRIDEQLGSEEVASCHIIELPKELRQKLGLTPCGECFVCHMTQVFHEVHRVLRDDGTLWLNLGDTIDGELEGVPWRTALALQADGWYLKSDIIWHNPSKMPESCLNRCTKQHEYVFQLAKIGTGYFFDMEAIKEPSVKAGVVPGGKRYADQKDVGSDYIGATRATLNEAVVRDTRAKRSVWSISSQGYTGAHFAVFPLKLVEPCLLSGTSAYGACKECGKPWERFISKTSNVRVEEEDRGDRDRSVTRNRNGITGSLDGTPARSTTLGWQKQCDCKTDEVVPCVVLDPFIGSGTTCAVAIERGQRGIGIDLSETYLRENAIPRIMAAKLMIDPSSTLPKFRYAPPIPPKRKSLFTTRDL